MEDERVYGRWESIWKMGNHMEDGKSYGRWDCRYLNGIVYMKEEIVKVLTK
jgi:hypothetical protein